MSAVDASIVFLPRFTTLIGGNPAAGGMPAVFTTLPLDVARYAGAQFQVWRGPGLGTFTVYLEESLDAETWVLGPSTPEGYAIDPEENRFFSYDFRLRWFRLRVVLSGVSNMATTCWAEGLLRGGGGGAWERLGRDGEPTVGVETPVTPPAPEIGAVARSRMGKGIDGPLPPLPPLPPSGGGRGKGLGPPDDLPSRGT